MELARIAKDAGVKFLFSHDVKALRKTGRLKNQAPRPRKEVGPGAGHGDVEEAALFFCAL